MKYRDYIIGPKYALKIPEGKVLAVIEGDNSTNVIDFPDGEEIYKKAITSFCEWNVMSCAVVWKGLPLRASTGTPVDLIKKGVRPVVYFREPTEVLREPSELGYPSYLLERFREVKTGLVLFCGSQGSGKTTGMMSILRDRIRTNGERAVTFEAPIEYEIRGVYGSGYIDQVSVPSEKQYKECSSISLRMASPDIVCYGEIRDYEGVKEICNNAFSSHIVMTTLHSTDLVAGIERFITLLMAGEIEHREYFMRVLSESLKLCIHQRLVREDNQVRLELEYLQYTEELRSAIYSGAASARIREILSRQTLLRTTGEL